MEFKWPEPEKYNKSLLRTVIADNAKGTQEICMPFLMAKLVEVHSKTQDEEGCDPLDMSHHFCADWIKVYVMWMYSRCIVDVL